MTGFITHCWQRAWISFRVRTSTASLLLAGLLSATVHAQTGVEVSQFELSRAGGALECSATVTFELRAAVEAALLKGLPVIFVTEAEVYRERWYWLDRRVGGAQRQMRLVFQPLVRRWRLSVGAGETSGGEAGEAQLAQTFDTLDEALGVIRRVAGWRIAEMSALEPGSRHRVEFRFRLDVAQLPRPLQIGALGESDWALEAAVSKRFHPESLK